MPPINRTTDSTATPHAAGDVMPLPADGQYRAAHLEVFLHVSTSALPPRAAGGLTFRLAPRGSSQSQGSVERFHETLDGQGRALRLHVETAYTVHLNNKNSIMTRSQDMQVGSLDDI